MNLFMTTDAVGGVWTYALDLAEQLGMQGVATTLALLGPQPSEAQFARAGQVRGLTLLETGLPLDWTAHAEADLEQASRAICSLARDVHADLVHLNSPAFAAFGDYPAPVVVACHSCLATWWEAVKGGPMPDDFRWRTDLVRRGYERAAALVAPSASFAHATARAYGVAPPRVVRNGRSLLRAVDGASPAAPPFVFTAGRLWDEGKNLAALDEAASRLDAPVYAAGPLRSPGGQAVQPRAVRPLGALDERAMSSWLHAAPVYCATPLYEPFGLGVLEAAQAGCALVLSDIPTLRELWEGAAVFVPPGDPAAIAGALREALEPGSAAAGLVIESISRAAVYSVEAMAEGMLSIYKDAQQVSRGVSA